MFKDEADARAVIKQYCTRERGIPIKSAQTELIISRLLPQFWIEPVSDTAASTWRTHFGGAPELPMGAAWPLRPIPADAHRRAVEFSKYDNQRWVAAHITRELPFEFMAQIDLAEAARYPAPADGLPTSGRLLFFWDSDIGPFVEGAAAYKVIWDDTPAADLAAVAIPAVFAELEAAFAIESHAAGLAARESLLKALPDTIEFMRSAGLSQADLDQAVKAIQEQFAEPLVFDPSLKKPYVHPRRAMKLTPILHLPHSHSTVAALDPELRQLLNSDAGVCYLTLTSRDEGPFTKETSGMRRQRFLGTPDPEQDDPLYLAIDTSKYPEGAWSDATIQDASQQATAWRLLLQVDLSDFSGSGTAYFMIHTADLARRDFSQVHACFQTT
jgi:uncharacterized protein YwqG